ncbi:unnamed protein product [Aspergillus oryzae RIB40]|uniref:Unnamed protein product n=3 Tax=Aspergillus oryzae TaxID=5062 RepID=A0A1S9DMF4_ASPOZ|nr:unnamed protein product [Aspergillus oryzae RIB40]OOO10251.1 hypothetical protein OAory_01060590 [Aspergillus oryzae]GMG54373.1 unnamed protein product [Aspergillus oryzae var. brunneus]BAE57848.1 unnamed protein product [Aspergillus oryzae RIB40]GMG14166.1 unnamed protein product [Aspergillus oryzae]GMG35512.1 unnamed protein product [Aspergillus oryzae]
MFSFFNFKELYYNRLSYPGYLTALSSSSANVFLGPRTLSRSLSSAGTLVSPRYEPTRDQIHQVGDDDQHASCEFWCGLRLQSQLNQSYVPPGPDREQQQREQSSKSSPREQTPSKPKPLPQKASKSTPLPPTRNTLMSCDAHGHRLREKPQNELHNPRRKSKKLAVSFNPTPTEYLIDTLQNVVHCPDSTTRQNWTFTSRNPNDRLMPPLDRKQRIKFKIEHRVSLQEIAADYIYHVDRLLDLVGEEGTQGNSMELDVALRKVFLNKEYRKYLRARQYSVKDVVSWAWILKSRTPYEAILRVFALEIQSDPKEKGGSAARIIPPFIPLLLLRQGLDTKSFRLLLIYSLRLISGQPHPKLGTPLSSAKDYNLFDELRLSHDAKPLIDPNTCATFVVRLLHHARQLWPQAQLPIVRTFAFYLTLLEPEGTGTVASATPRNIQVLAGKCNTFLRLLSLPCRQGPFTSASIQQQAQFELLRAMARNQPVLPVTRGGYQGIIAVQLAHKKTSAERQSAELKAPSWPPWKEEKLGLDSQRGIEGLRSRAMRVMSQMKEAGYAHSRWEEVSSILAGWDTDKSPTIQTRTLARQPWRLRGRIGNADHHAIWEARIRATRTVREAWACFLSYRDQGLPPRGSIYTAMAEKLIYRRKALHANFDQTSHALPGDALETFAEPLSARDLIYVHTEPPTLDELLTQMLSEGIRPQARFLSLLLRYAPTFKSGLEYLSCSDMSNEQIRALCTVWAHESIYDEQSRKVVNELPAHLFSSFVYFLCKFSTFGELSARHARDAFPIILGSSQMANGETSTLFSQDEYLRNGDEYRHPKTLAHAIELLRVRHPRSPQAWVFVLSALNKDRVTGRFRKMDRDIQRVIAWHEILEIAGRMEHHDIQLGLQGFQILCSGFSRAVSSGIKNVDAVEEALEVVGNAAHQGKLAYIGLPCPRFEDMVQYGLRGLKDQFDRLVLPDFRTPSLFGSGKPYSENVTDAQVILPPLLHVPSPAVLHAFVRSLGLAEDYDGLLSLLRWMSQYATPLKEASDEYLNGDMMMRRTLVAMRLFLEGYRERQSWGSLRWTASAAQARGLGGSEYTSEVSPSDSERMSFSDPNLQEAYDIVTATHVWGPWPSDEEVQEYYAVHWEEHEVQ